MELGTAGGNGGNSAAALRPGLAGTEPAASHALFETVFRRLPDIVLLIDEASGTIVEANDSVRRILGRDARSLIGRRLSDALSFIGGGSAATLLELVRQHATVVGEWDVRRIDGSPCPMHATACLTAWEGRAAVLVTLRDVTQRRKAEAALGAAERKYRSIFENTIEGIFQTTADGRYISANPALARIYGYASPEDLVGTLTDIACDLYVDPARRDEFRRLLEEHDSVQGFESQVYRADGSIVWISENARAVRDDTGELQYYEGTVIDVTRRKRAEEEQQHLLEALARANRLKSEFVAAMSHELRTPLHIILGYDELLLTDDLGSLSAEQREALEQIGRSGRDLLALIDQTLDLNRLDSGRLPVSRTPIDPAHVLAELRAELAELTVKPGVAVVWEIAAGLPILETDASKLKVILKNLIGNAMKFTDAGSVRIGARQVGSGVEMAVADTGIGIAPEAMPIIFEAFRQVDGSMTRRHGGIGLGLHLARRLLELLGGTIAVESVPQAGSTFRIWIPCRP